MQINEFIEKYTLEKQKSSDADTPIHRLYRHKLNALKVMNQDIVFRDLIIQIDEKFRFGEAEVGANTRPSNAQYRLRQHIAFLIDFVNADHRANFCEPSSNENFQIKIGKENHVTRLFMPENYLYTPAPLTWKEYQDLYLAIEAMAELLEPNAHILLSSFAVLNQDNILLNMCIYVEGGKPPKLHGFAKALADVADFNYSQTKSGKQRLFSAEDTGVTSDFSTSPSGTHVYNGSVFEIQTVGKAAYTQLVDICLDYQFRHSVRQLNRSIFFNEITVNEIIPQQIEYCVTSNSILVKFSILNGQIIHADPRASKQLNDDSLIGKKVIPSEGMIHLTETYSLVKIQETKNGYHITNPIFGFDFSIKVLPLRKASTFIDVYNHAIEAHNKQAIQHILIKAELNPFSIFHKMHTMTTLLAQELHELELNLYALCKPTLFETLFKTVDYIEKLRAEMIVHTHLSFLKTTIHKHKLDALAIFPAWKKDFIHKLDFMCPSIGNSLKKALVDRINLLEDTLEDRLNNKLSEP